MTSDRHEPDPPNVVERGLQAWEVPEPPHGLTDRILSANAQTLRDLAQPTVDAPQLEPDPPAMLPTDLQTNRNLRPFLTATFIGFAAAAALILAFVAGRQSTPPPELAPAMPKVEVSVSTPVAAPVPPQPETPAPPAPPTPPAAADPDEAPAPPPEPRRTPRPKAHKATAPTDNAELKNPFDDPTDAVLRIGTERGVGPATVFLDGVELGKTPLARVRVSAGKHEVRFEWPGRTVVHEVSVAEGEAKLVRGTDVEEP